MEPLTAVYASNSALYMYLPMAINSLLKSNPDAKVYVFADDDFIDVLKHPSVTVINSKIYDSYILPTSPQYEYYLPRATFVRLWIAETLKESRALWLDVDTIVDADLTPLWTIDMGENIVAGVPDRFANVFPHITSQAYINAGVLLMDLDKWRKYGLVEKAKEMINNEEWKYGDQDIINKMCEHKTLYLNGEYNFSKVTYCSDVQVPKIYHYADHPKLWEAHARMNYANKRLWEKYHVDVLS